MEDKNYLMEAFKEFDALNEEVFDISIEDGFQKAKEFKDAVVDDFEPIVVIDDTVENEEDVETSYVGKVILQCPTCLSMVYRDPEDVIIDEELEIANVGDVCPTCQSEDGFKIIGEVSDFEDEECTCEDGECTCKDKEEIKVDDVDSIDDEADYFNGEDEEELKEALPNNIKIVKTFKDKDDGRTHVIAYRPSDETYIIGLGYDKKSDRWAQGKYDFKSMTDAIKALTADYNVFCDECESLKARAKIKTRKLEEGESLKARMARKAQKDPLDDIDADADDKKEIAKKKFAKAKDDADADRDYKLNKAKLKEAVKMWRTQKSLKESKVLNETGEWDDSDEDMIAWKKQLFDLIKKNTTVDISMDDIKGFDAYQGPYAYVDGIEFWTDSETGGLLAHNLDHNINSDSNWYRINSKVDFRKMVQGTLNPLKESIKSRKRVRVSKEDKINEDFNKVDIETDREKMSMTADENGKVTVTTEPVENVKPEGEGEMIVPISDETKEKFKTAEEEEEYVDVDFDEFEEKDFDSLGESYLKNVYENVKSFNTTKGEISGNTLKLEGVIKFKSGKTVKTGFVFEAKSVSKNGKLKFIGENLQITKRQPAFTLIGSVEGKKLCCESLAYKYNVATQEGKSQRVKGVVTR